MKSGQILILVLLIVVVTLAVGLSVASRNLTNLRTATQTEQSQRAFSAAEGGVEDVLSRLTAITSAHGTDIASSTGYAVTGVPLMGDITPSVVVQSSSTYEKTIELGEVGQINVASMNEGTTVNIEWAKNSDPSEAGQPASIEVIQVNGSTSVPYSQTRTAYTGYPGRDEVGFSAPSGCPSTDFQRCTTITLASNPQILRIRPFWVKATVRVSGVGAATLPTQTYDVTSTAQTDLGLTRKVQVTRSAWPQIPAVFDFAMYSEGSIEK